MAARFGRGVLALNAILIGKTGLEYINGTWAGAQPANYPTLATLFTANVFSGGPAVPLLVPFMGCAYLAVSTMNLAAALLFGYFEHLARTARGHMSSSCTRLVFSVPTRQSLSVMGSWIES